MSTETGERTLKLWWTVPVAVFALLFLLALVFGQEPPPLQPGTSYDASDRGFRAAYLLLEELDYPVTRSRRASAGRLRWLLFPQNAPREMAQINAWVRGGGRMLLVTDREEFAGGLGMSLLVTSTQTASATVTAGGEQLRLAGGPTRVEWPGGHRERVWGTVGGEPLVSVYRHGQGEIWLAHWPGFFNNKQIREADNAVLICRLAEAMLDDSPDRIAFDEFYHGLRERPGVLELLFSRPVLWVTLQGLLLLGVVLWRFIPRFGPVRPEQPALRRSKEEFLDALAFLLQRRGDHADAYRSARDTLLRELERDLGLPPDANPALVIEEAARYRGLSTERLSRLLGADSPPGGAGPQNFVNAMRELEAIHNEFFTRERRR
jgi:Domain of unknown function (DUF4350)